MRRFARRAALLPYDTLMARDDATKVGQTSTLLPSGQTAAAVAGSPDQNELREAKRAILRGVLRQAGITATTEIVERLIAAVQVSRQIPPGGFTDHWSRTS